MQGLRGDRYAPGEILPRRSKVVAAFVAAPVRQYLRHGHAAPKLRAEFAIDGRQHVLGPHRRADTHMRGLVAKTGGVGAELPRALQVHRLRVENPHQSHGPVHTQDFVRVFRELRQRRHGVAGRVQDLPVVNFELGNHLHP